MAIDYLTVKLKASMPKEKFNGEIFETKIDGKKVFLVKPLTYMNESGRCIQEIMQFYKISTENIVIIYDDIDIPEGTLRLRAKGGPGTHNGMRSIVSCISSDNFPRIRIGTGNPIMKQMDLADFVLGKFSKESEDLIVDAVKRAGDAAEMLAKDGIEKAMQKYNQK